MKIYFIKAIKRITSIVLIGIMSTAIIMTMQRAFDQPKASIQCPEETIPPGETYQYIVPNPGASPYSVNITNYGEGFLDQGKASIIVYEDARAIYSGDILSPRYKETDVNIQSLFIDRDLFQGITLQWDRQYCLIIKH